MITLLVISSLLAASTCYAVSPPVIATTFNTKVKYLGPYTEPIVTGHINSDSINERIEEDWTTVYTDGSYTFVQTVFLFNQNAIQRLQVEFDAKTKKNITHCYTEASTNTWESYFAYLDSASYDGACQSEAGNPGYLWKYQWETPPSYSLTCVSVDNTIPYYWNITNSLGNGLLIYRNFKPNQYDSAAFKLTCD